MYWLVFKAKSSSASLAVGGYGAAVIFANSWWISPGLS